MYRWCYLDKAKNEYVLMSDEEVSILRGYFNLDKKRISCPQKSKVALNMKMPQPQLQYYVKQTSSRDVSYSNRKLASGLSKYQYMLEQNNSSSGRINHLIFKGDYVSLFSCLILYMLPHFIICRQR